MAKVGLEQVRFGLRWVWGEQPATDLPGLLNQGSVQGWGKRTEQALKSIASRISGNGNGKMATATATALATATYPDSR